jgi:hypothetical protein
MVERNLKGSSIGLIPSLEAQKKIWDRIAAPWLGCLPNASQICYCWVKVGR